ncbi:hypothetical protein D3C86_1990400 [compost metagenome]
MQIHTLTFKNLAQFIGGFQLAFKDQIAPRHVKCAGNMAAFQARARLVGLGSKARRRAGIDDLLRFLVARQ